MSFSESNAQDAIELLGPFFTHPFVRRFAVSKLQAASFSTIILFLPQLVQALRYEARSNVNDMLIVTKESKVLACNVAIKPQVYCQFSLAQVCTLTNHLTSPRRVVDRRGNREWLPNTSEQTPIYLRS